MTTRSRYCLEALQVLFVDDIPHMHKIVRGLLLALEVRNVHTVSDVDSALEKLQDIPIDLVITDWHMHPISGLDFVRRLRREEDSPNPCIPIIMLSGFTEDHRVAVARDAGVNEFLAKPVSGKALYSRVVSIIDHPRSFVRTTTFFGPDRRRKDLGPPEGTSERRKKDGDPA